MSIGPILGSEKEKVGSVGRVEASIKKVLK